MIDVNLNSHVYVRLTDVGREELRRQHRELRTHLSGVPGYDLSRLPGDGVPKEADGWSRWPLWDLMNRLGALVYLGGPPPFETTIRIETEN